MNFLERSMKRKHWEQIEILTVLLQEIGFLNWARFWYIKIQPKTIDASTQNRGITPQYFPEPRA